MFMHIQVHNIIHLKFSQARWCSSAFKMGKSSPRLYQKSHWRVVKQSPVYEGRPYPVEVIQLEGRVSTALLSDLSNTNTNFFQLTSTASFRSIYHIYMYMVWSQYKQ